MYLGIKTNMTSTLYQWDSPNSQCHMRWLYEILESNIRYRTEGRWFIWGRTLDGVCIPKEKQNNSFWDRIGQVHHRSYPCPPRPTPTQWDTLKLSTSWGNPLCCDNFSQVCNLPASSVFQVQTLSGLNKEAAFDISCCQLKSGPSFTKILENLWMKRNNSNKEQLVMGKQIIQWKRVVCFLFLKSILRDIRENTVFRMLLKQNT